MRKLGLLLLFAAAAAYGDEVTVVTIQCPADTKAKLNWQDHAGNDPTYSVEDTSQHWVLYGFETMTRSGQVITCRYKSGTYRMLMRAIYEYKVKRQIASCKPPTGRTLECKLQ